MVGSPSRKRLVAVRLRLFRNDYDEYRGVRRDALRYGDADKHRLVTMFLIVGGMGAMVLLLPTSQPFYRR